MRSSRKLQQFLACFVMMTIDHFFFSRVYFVSVGSVTAVHHLSPWSPEANGWSSHPRFFFCADTGFSTLKFVVLLPQMALEEFTDIF